MLAWRVKVLVGVTWAWHVLGVTCSDLTTWHAWFEFLAWLGMGWRDFTWLGMLCLGLACVDLTFWRGWAWVD